jgi:hypothetical protein
MVSKLSDGDLNLISSEEERRRGDDVREGGREG